MLMEQDVKVISRKEDESIVKKASDGAKTQYKEVSGRDVNVSVVADLTGSM